MFIYIAIAFFAYFCGSIPFAKIIGYRYGVDIQKRGSGNIGFANVLRVLGWRAAFPVLLLDAAKSFLPTFLAYYVLGEVPAFTIGIIAMFGHIFPLWLHFKGGKGIASGLGVLFAIMPLVGVLALLVYALSSWLLKKSSYASMVAGVAVLVTTAIITPGLTWQIAIMLLIATWALRKNLFGTVPNYDDI